MHWLYTHFFYLQNNIPLRGKVGQLSKRMRGHCWSIYNISLWLWPKTIFWELTIFSHLNQLCFWQGLIKNPGSEQLHLLRIWTYCTTARATPYNNLPPSLHIHSVPINTHIRKDPLMMQGIIYIHICAYYSRIIQQFWSINFARRVPTSYKTFGHCPTDIQCGGSGSA